MQKIPTHDKYGNPVLPEIKLSGLPTNTERFRTLDFGIFRLQGLLINLFYQKIHKEISFLLSRFSGSSHTFPR